MRCIAGESGIVRPANGLGKTRGGGTRPSGKAQVVRQHQARQTRRPKLRQTQRLLLQLLDTVQVFPTDDFLQRRGCEVGFPFTQRHCGIEAILLWTKMVRPACQQPSPVRQFQGVARQGRHIQLGKATIERPEPVVRQLCFRRHSLPNAVYSNNARHVLASPASNPFRTGNEISASPSSDGQYPTP